MSLCLWALARCLINKQHGCGHYIITVIGFEPATILVVTGTTPCTALKRTGSCNAIRYNVDCLVEPTDTFVDNLLL